MISKIKNLVFQGVGVLGIAYLGAMDYLSEKGIFQGVSRVVGVSSGAIAACISSFNLPFEQSKIIADSLEYKKVPEKREVVAVSNLSNSIKDELEGVFGDIHCLHRLVHNFGYYSTDYIYMWIKEKIDEQFDSSKKQPPYTFSDFMDVSIHKNERQFKELYLYGTNISLKTSRLFSYNTTPNMDVAEAVRISMSVPLFFECAKMAIPGATNKSEIDGVEAIFSDGGIMANYPINLFDYKKINSQTLGIRVMSDPVYKKINNILDYVVNLMETFISVQDNNFNNSPSDKVRTIQIMTGKVSVMDFNISNNDDTYNYLYKQGYNTAKVYFEK